MSRRMLRVGTVPYLNARPLTFGLERRRDVSLVALPPSRLIETLRSGAVDVALASSIELYRGGELRALEGMAVCSDGPVRSIRLFARRPLEAMRTVSLDRSSCTAAALVHVLHAARGGGRLAATRCSPEARLDSLETDGLLLIGDAALRTDQTAPYVYDLGEEWIA